MGQEKQNRLNKNKEFNNLETLFLNDGIDSSKFGFYDQEEFIIREKENPEYMVNYAKWVMLM